MAEGELFVPYNLVPGKGGAGNDVALGVRIRNIRGLPPIKAQRLCLALRFGPLTGPNGREVDKKAELSIKCQVELVQAADGTWQPLGAERGGLTRVPLPPLLLAQSTRGIACRLKVLAPGVFSPTALAVSVPILVPLESGDVPLSLAKVGKTPPPPTFVSMSVSRLFSLQAQTAIARSLIQQLFAQLKEPAGHDVPADKQPSALEALRPTRGWLPAAGVPKALQSTEMNGKTALRLAVDSGHMGAIKPLLEARCDPHALAADLRSPFTAMLERGEQLEVLKVLDPSLSSDSLKVAGGISKMLLAIRGPRPTIVKGSTEAALKWEEMAEPILQCFQPPPFERFFDASPGRPPPTAPPVPGSSLQAKWSGDILILSLEHCPTGRSRRKLLLGEGVCVALWHISLSQDLPDLARKLAIWIGLSANNGPVYAGSPSSRRRLLDVKLDEGSTDSMLARALERGMEDERWLKVARVMVHLGADVTGVTASGRSMLLLALDKADADPQHFGELLSSLLDKLGDDVDHWEEPTVLIDENPAECPICMEVLWKSTPTSFVKFDGVSPHVMCAHFFCFDCASQQFMKQQSKELTEFECPICRAPATDVMPLPDIAINPRLWFQFLDVKGEGRIDKNTVVQTLEAMLPIDTEKLRECLQDHVWAQWDKVGDNVISEREFFDSGGLLEWVRRHQHELRAAEVRGPAPSLEKEPERWFKHWDAAKCGRLGKSEVLRGCCEAASVSSLDVKRIKALKDGIAPLWEKHATDDTVSRDRFLRKKVGNDLHNLCKEVSG
mmetsp:Transcript_45893/g.99047  ORF Transcript_45893/g.99047 Transcript_45893/m.99047 type:complete len:782 (+) Transcript_45893:97-2442(+)